VNEETKALARHRLTRARESFEEGEVLLAQRSPRGAVNRFYYATFYAARSLLATCGLDSSRHSGVISLFHKHFVKTGQVSVENAKALSRSFEKRQKTDYADFVSVSLEESTMVRDEADAFIVECEAALQRLVGQRCE